MNDTTKCRSAVDVMNELAAERKDKDKDKRGWVFEEIGKNLSTFACIPPNVADWIRKDVSDAMDTPLVGSNIDKEAYEKIESLGNKIFLLSALINQARHECSRCTNNECKFREDE